MSVARFRLVPFVTLLAIAPITTAQVPVGSAVVGTASGPSSSGTAGLFLVALPGGAVTPVTGLPAYLRSTGATATEQGVASVAWRSGDGAIVVGTVAAAGGPALGNVELFLFYLNGSAVDPTRTRQIQLGTTTNSGGAWVVVLPDDRILVAAGQGGGLLPTGPMANHALAIVDVSTPTPSFTLLPQPTIPAGGLGGGVAVDPTGRFVYMPYTTTPGQPTRVATLYRHELATGQTCAIATWPGQLAQGLWCDDDDTVYVNASNLTTLAHHVHAVRPDGCNAATVTTTQSLLSVAPSGLALDRASGRFLVPSAAFAPGFPVANLNRLWLVDPATGAATPVAGSPQGWGSMSRSVAVNNAIDSYGARSDGQNHYWFDNFPNPGGQPTIGNLGFTLTMAASSGTATASVLALSFGRGSTTLLGAEILVDLSSIVTFGVPSGTAVPFALPIPPVVGLSGLVLTAQSLHIEPNNGLAGSRGLTLTLQ